MATAFSRTTRSLALDSSRYALLAWLLGGLFLLAWLAWFIFARITVYEVSSHARLEVNHSAHPLAALVAGKVVASFVQLGQEVNAGDVLIELDSSREKLRLQEEQAKLAALPAQLASIDKQMAGLGQAKSKDQQAALAALQSAKARQQEADAAVAFAQDNEQRMTAMRDAIPQIEIVRAHAESQKLSSARDALAGEIQRLAMDAQMRGHQEQADIENLKRESARLQGEMASVAASLDRLQQDIGLHLIRAPASGKVGELAALQIGTYVTVGDKLGAVVPDSALSIIGYFPPAAVLGRIHPEQSARMRLDGFPWAQFGTIAAKVSRVGAEIRDQQVRVEFTPEQAADSKILLQHGLPGVIEVSIEQTSPALLMLRSAGQLMAGQPQKTP
ncbi:hypothetical protein JCM14076_28940 [Methylosoma difficile]